ncbi:MAG: hypothetical protein HY231_27070 [Acidobacteria bacterium]|nr:hypothetical protein [Acidobacteriota bacterium]
MEKEQEIKKLTSVLRRIARSASYAAWYNAAPDAAAFCVRQYNGVLKRLTELEPQVAHAFAPLAETASPQVTRLVARGLCEYFADQSDAQAAREAPYRSLHTGCWGAKKMRHGWAAFGRW